MQRQKKIDKQELRLSFVNFVCIIVIADEEKDENHINFSVKISSQRNH